MNRRLATEDVDSPLAQVRPVKTVAVCLVTGDRGLCGGYNNFAIKKVLLPSCCACLYHRDWPPIFLTRGCEMCLTARLMQAEARIVELQEQGLGVLVVTIGNKGTTYFKRRPQYNLARSFELGQSPTTKEAQAIADEIFADFVSAKADKVEMVYTKFQSLVSSDPVIQSMLPLTPQGEMCDVEGNCIDPADDELFVLTTKGGTLTLERESTSVETEDLDAGLIFEQDPSQLLDALLPLYLNSVVLRALQESLASELAARMNAMNSASDNAKSLSKNLTTAYNRKRQAAITSQIIEIISGSEAAA